MIELHPNTLSKHGKPEFVVLPYEEYESLLEWLTDLEDLLELRRAKQEEQDAPTMSLEEVKQLLGHRAQPDQQVYRCLPPPVLESGIHSARNQLRTPTS